MVRALPRILARALLAALGLSAVISSSGCFMMRRPTADVEVPQSTAPAAALPVPAAPDAVPKAEPKSRHGNPPYYDVFGKRYYVLSSSAAYVERGVASWYGPGFHRVKTSSGELYDMYGMTAAHKTLPLPARVRVTNLENGRSVVVRVNDRGPFIGNRIIDLSYGAAAKLDMLHNGTAMVEVRSLDTLGPEQNLPLMAGAAIAPASGQGGAGTSPVPAPQPPVATASGATVVADAAIAAVKAVVPTAAAATDATPGIPAAATPAAAIPAAVPTAATPMMAATATPMVAAPTATPISPSPRGATKPVLFVQAGAFSDPANAERLAVKLRGGAYGKIVVRDDVIAGRRMYRVRIGPVHDVRAFDRIYAALERDGVHDAHLALD